MLRLTLMGLVLRERRRFSVALGAHGKSLRSAGRECELGEPRRFASAPPATASSRPTSFKSEMRRRLCSPPLVPRHVAPIHRIFRWLRRCSLLPLTRKAPGETRTRIADYICRTTRFRRAFYFGSRRTCSLRAMVSRCIPEVLHFRRQCPQSALQHRRNGEQGSAFVGWLSAESTMSGRVGRRSARQVQSCSLKRRAHSLAGAIPACTCVCCSGSNSGPTRSIRANSASVPK